MQRFKAKHYKNYQELTKSYDFLPEDYNSLTSNQKGVINNILKFGIQFSFDKDYNLDCVNCVDCKECCFCIFCRGCIFCRYCKSCTDCFYSQDLSNATGRKKKYYFQKKLDK